MRGRALATAFCLFVSPALALARSALPDFAPGGAVAARAVIDGATIALEDGRILRLTGIDAPQKPLAARATDALAKMIAGQPLELRIAGNGSDRNGRVVAALFAGGRWVQRELVRRGLARVRGTGDNRLGVTELLAAEDAARKARRGLWRLRLYAVRPAEDAARDAGTWQIVEGKVFDVAQVEGGAYLNFGPDWHTAFSVHLSREAQKLVRAAGLDPRSLAGARLRVRGFIDGTRRPTIEVTFPEQIERL